MPRDYEAEDVSRRLRGRAQRIMQNAKSVKNKTPAMVAALDSLWRSKVALERTECRLGVDFDRYCDAIQRDIDLVCSEVWPTTVKVRGRHRAYDDRSWVRKIYERYTR